MTLATAKLERRLLYFITPSVGSKVSPSSLPTVVQRALRGGVEAVLWRQHPLKEELNEHPRVLKQWEERAKTPFLLPVAKQVRDITNRFHAPLLVSDSTRLAEAIDADGLHVGQDDMEQSEVFLVREQREPRTVGVTVRSPEETRAACEAGAAYLAAGPVFPSTTQTEDPIKLEGLRACVDAAMPYGVPVIAVGGLSLGEGRISQCMEEGGASGIAVGAAISGVDDIEAAAAAFAHELDPFRHSE